MNLENRIRELRKEKKITQLQLSIALNVTQETISSYEHNRHLPSLTALLKMSELFDASMDYIMGVSDVRIPHIVNSSIDRVEQEQIAKLNYHFHRLSSKNKMKALAYLEGLYDAVKD